MKKQKFTLVEAVSLNQEMNSLMQEDTVSFGTKYELAGMLEKVAKVTERFEKQRVDIFKKFGKETTEGSYNLEGCEGKEEAVKQLNVLANKEETFDFKKLSLDDFKDIKSKYPYWFIYKLV